MDILLRKISFKIVDTLIPVLKKVFPDSTIVQNIKLRRIKVTNIIKNVISSSEKLDIAKILKMVPFSIHSDESTDVSTAKLMAMLVRYFNPLNNTIKTNL